MKKIFSIVVAMIAGSGLFASQGLVVTQKYTDAASKGATVTVTWYITATQCKMKMSYADDKVNSTTYFIPDVANGKLLTYSDGAVPGGGDKRFYSVPVQSIKSNIDVSRVTVTKTGEVKTIGGMVCEKVTVKTNRSTTEMWITKDFKPDYYTFFAFFQSSYELMGLSQESLQGIPLESVTRDNAGAVMSSFQLVSASNADLSAGDFTVPVEYKSADAVTGK
jgi:hypothetical protein